MNPRKVRIVVARGHLFHGELHIVARGQLHRRFRADGAFQMQVQFCFGEGVEDRWLPGRLRRHVNLVARQLRAAGVDPRRHPVGSEVG